jgi:hypothetical protein
MYIRKLLCWQPAAVFYNQPYNFALTCLPYAHVLTAPLAKTLFFQELISILITAPPKTLVRGGDILYVQH